MNTSLAYRASEPSCARVSALRQHFIAEGVLRPDRNAERAPSPWDRLSVMQLPAGTVVLRLDERTRAQAEARARS